MVIKNNEISPKKTNQQKKIKVDSYTRTPISLKLNDSSNLPNHRKLYLKKRFG